MTDRSQLSQFHKAEWAQFRKENLDPALEAGDYDQARTAKTLADAVRLTQDGERRAFEFGDGIEETGPATISWLSDDNG